MSDRKREPPNTQPADEQVDQEEFDSLLREMEETFAIERTGDDEDTEDLEETGELGIEELDDDAVEEVGEEREVSAGYHFDSGMVERLDDVVIDFARQTVDPEEPGPEPSPIGEPLPPPPPPSLSRPVKESTPPAPVEHVTIPDDVTLSVRFSVHAATGGGQFRDSEAKGLLVGQRTYPIVLLDDFAFGFANKRNEYEIILDPAATESTLKALEPQGDFTVMCDEYGEMWVLKPHGVRLDLYQIDRLPSGERRMQQIKTSEQDTMEPVWLPTDSSLRFDQYTEFMLGVGLTEEESLCYAFSLYVAVGLSRPKDAAGS